MLDVHSPHQNANSWKDFWIHLGTITAGLLIAISLEQTVEALHHLHQRHELEHDLREEASKNLILMDIDNRNFDTYIPQLTTRIQDIAAIQTGHAKSVPADHPTPPAPVFWFPDPPAWETAKESGLVILLPRDEAAMFNLVYSEQELMTEEYNNVLAAREAQRNFEQRFSNDPPGLPQPDLTRMTPAELGQYLGLVIATLNETRNFKRRTDVAYKVTLAARNGATTDEELFRMLGGRPGETPAAPPTNTPQR